MANFNPNNKEGNAKRAAKAMTDAIRTPPIMDELTADESDLMHHLRDVMVEIYNRERIKNG